MGSEGFPVLRREEAAIFVGFQVVRGAMRLSPPLVVVVGRYALS